MSTDWDGEGLLVPALQRREKHARLSSGRLQQFSGSHSPKVRHAYSHSYTFAVHHFPKLPKLAKESCLGGTTAGGMECARPGPAPGTPMPAIPPIITGVAMPIFMLMFIPTMPWFTGIPPIPMVPVVIERGILDAKEAGRPIVIALLAIMGLAGGLLGVTWGGELRFSPPKLWGNKLTGGTPARTYMDGEGVNPLQFR